MAIPVGSRPSTDIVGALRTWIDTREVAGPVRPTSLLFCPTNIHGGLKIDKPIDGETVSRVVRKRLEDVGIDNVKDFSGHSLRRGYITSAARSGNDAITISKHSRHKTIDIVAEYVESADAMDQAALIAEKIGL